MKAYVFIVSMLFSGVWLFSCTSQKLSHFLVALPVGNYSLELDMTGLDLKRDTNKIYIGNPVLFSFKSSIESLSIDIYLGTKNPIQDWKQTFDFGEKQLDLEKQVSFDSEKQFVGVGQFITGNAKGKLVHYNEEYSQKIEGQFVVKDIIVNVVMRGDNEVLDFKEKFKKVMRTVKVSE